MSLAVFAGVAFSTLRPRAWRAPSRCPYCPIDAPPHWTCWGRYWRYAGDPDDPSKRVAIPRRWCKFVKRTFSLPPDSLLPYCGIRTGTILKLLHALFVQKVALNALARQVQTARGTLRGLKARFLRTLSKLRLPVREGTLGPAAFLAILARMPATDAADLFRDWKEREPKHSIVGIYLRC